MKLVNLAKNIQKLANVEDELFVRRLALGANLRNFSRPSRNLSHVLLHDFQNLWTSDTESAVLFDSARTKTFWTESNFQRLSTGMAASQLCKIQGIARENKVKWLRCHFRGVTRAIIVSRFALRFWDFSWDGLWLYLPLTAVFGVRLKFPCASLDIFTFPADLASPLGDLRTDRKCCGASRRTSPSPLSPHLPIWVCNCNKVCARNLAPSWIGKFHIFRDRCGSIVLHLRLQLRFQLLSHLPHPVRAATAKLTKTSSETTLMVCKDNGTLTNWGNDWDKLSETCFEPMTWAKPRTRWSKSQENIKMWSCPDHLPMMKNAWGTLSHCSVSWLSKSSNL